MSFITGLQTQPIWIRAANLMVVFERSLLLVFVAIGAVNWLDMARIVRGQTLSLKEREFVAAARLIGVSRFAIIRRHITPNLVGTVIVYLTLTIPQAILMESFLSFLGLGVQEPDASLGTLVNSGVAQMEQAPWMLLAPASLLALMLFCFNYLGDGLRDLADPRKQKQ
jgi:oligopeptide transport system permease protein